MLSIWTTVFFSFLGSHLSWQEMSDWVSRVTGSTTHVSDVTPLNKSNQSKHRIHHPRVWRHTPEQEQPIKTQDSPPTCLTSHPWTWATNQHRIHHPRDWRHTREQEQPIRTQDSPTNVSDVTPLNKSDQSKHRIHNQRVWRQTPEQEHQSKHRILHQRIWRHTPKQEQPIKTQDSPSKFLTPHP
jgi:hypothetical protein